MHFPFCSSRCGYCDFPTAAGCDERIPDYLSALEREISSRPSGMVGPVDTVYFGGGTPSRMSPVQVDGLVRAVRDRFGLLDRVEISLEANPEDLTAERLDGWKEAGVNRLSVGVQSLDDRVLERVGRGHDGAAALRALERAADAGFPNVGADLIAGLPGEDLRAWGETVSAVARRGPVHVSMYLLETDKDAPLARAIRSGRVSLAGDDDIVSAYRRSVELLETRGLRQYEISNFARPGLESRHNLKYWTDVAYEGFGVGAHGYFGGERRANPPDLERYVAAVLRGRDPGRRIDAWDGVRRLEEALMMGLRRVEGVDLGSVGERYGTDLNEAYGPIWERADRSGTVVRRGTRLALTPHGRLVSNELFREIIGFPIGGA